MSNKKTRTTIPSAQAAKVLFLADRTCCVCRVQGKAVQIHHIDDDPSNNGIRNLAVLCFDCHRETQIKGGFDRKLDAEQVTLYRDDWIRWVSRKRASEISNTNTEHPDHQLSLELATSLVEIYRESQDFTDLAIHYDGIGNLELRDKYIERAIEQGLGDEEVCFLRSLQGKPELIPSEVQERLIKRLSRTRNWLSRARIHKSVGKKREAVDDYLRGIKKSLDANQIFTGAYYLKELVEEGLIDYLFELALEQAIQDNELWWEIRCLQELGWEKELSELLLRREDEIQDSGDLNMLALLALTKGDDAGYIEIEKQIAQNEASATSYSKEEDHFI